MPKILSFKIWRTNVFNSEIPKLLGFKLFVSNMKTRCFKFQNSKNTQFQNMKNQYFQFRNAKNIQFHTLCLKKWRSKAFNSEVPKILRFIIFFSNMKTDCSRFLNSKSIQFHTFCYKKKRPSAFNSEILKILSLIFCFKYKDTKPSLLKYQKYSFKQVFFTFVKCSNFQNGNWIFSNYFISFHFKCKNIYYYFSSWNVAKLILIVFTEEYIPP